MTDTMTDPRTPNRATGGRRFPARAARSARTLRRATLVACALLLVGQPAWAHPFVRGGEAPVDSLASLTLAMAHGCGTEQAGGGDPTTEVAVEMPPGARFVDVPDREGWDVELEEDVDGWVRVATWIARDAAEPAPDLAFQAVFQGEPGDEVYLKVFQGCDGFAYRWIGTPDEPATDPAIRVRLVEADPDNPAPPEPEPAPEPEPEHEPEPGPEPEAPEDPEPDETPEVSAPSDDVDDEPADRRDRRGGLIALAVGVVVLGGGIWLSRRLRG